MTIYVPMLDLSKWQASNQEHPPVIPWNAAKAKGKGIRGVYIKATEGTQHVDVELRRNYESCRAEGLYKDLYHYFLNGAGKPQANLFLNALMDYPGDLRPAFDVEVRCRAVDLRAACERLLEAGTEPIIYTSPYAWNSYVSGTQAEKAWFSRFGLWLAAWPSGAPNINGPWPQPIGAWDRVVVHQYSAVNGLGREYGSNGDDDIDLDRADPVWFAQMTGEELPELPEPELPDRVRATTALNVRTAAVVSPATKIGTVKAGTRFDVIERSGDWLAVKAFIHGDYVEPV